MSFDADKDAESIGVSRETLDRLLAFQALVVKWNPAINLVSRADLSEIWHRHILDSVQIFQHLPDGAETWCDIGSGGGFPGLVVAILAREKAPRLKITLIESDKRKSVFLRHVAQDLDLSVTVVNDRIDVAEPQNADVVSARALAPLAMLCSFASRHISQNGTAIFPKGAGAVAEIEAARASWSFDLTPVPSTTNSDASILLLRDITHV